VTPVTAYLSKILYKSIMNLDNKIMQMTAGKLILFLFVLAGIAAVASVMGSPEFENIRLASPHWS